MGFVVVLHLSADRKSLLAEIISRWTAMPVSEAADGEHVEPNRVYVIPPGYIATVQRGRLRLRHLAPDVPREATPIDQFFDSLAADLGENAIGIVLSGTGHDGALGLKAIKARGGLTLAQGTDGSGPQHSGMPNSAIATGAADLIVPAQDMPRLVMASRINPSAPADTGDTATEIDTARLSICEILRAQLGHDFSQYKDKTFLRRVQRRTQVLGLTVLTDYVARLEQDRNEVVLLFRDLLIGVTTFFRDANAFEAVKRVVVPRLFQDKGACDTVRVWVPGCATGEEAYSLAILLREHMDELGVVPRVQIFATDIDEPAIATARSGRYPATLLAGLSPERRERFFNSHENSYLVSKEIRDLCTFSAHSLVRDPPFSRMNLVSCRNLLIYMDADLQATIIPAFHYSLAPGGVLLLGSSGTVARHDGLFAPLEKAHRIFQRRDGPSPSLQVATRRLPSRPANDSRATTGDAAKTNNRTDWPRSFAVAASRVLERFSSPYVVVTEDGDVAHYSSHVGSVLQPALGPPSRSVFDMIRRSLRHSARTALRNAAETGQSVELVVPPDADGTGAFTLVVEPLPGHEPDRPYLMVFKEHSASGGGQVQIHNDATAVALHMEMERENRDLRGRLQSLSEEHETSLQELRSSNEELHSVNEELQSTNEELETSKEEIQSVNEEMQTVNAQLSSKVDQLDRANSDLQNLGARQHDRWFVGDLRRRDADCAGGRSPAPPRRRTEPSG
jgi:two-component system, chemotaxis family, CheB/CheR fusion protein